MSIKIVAKHNVKPEKVDEFIKRCKPLVEATKKDDWGCIHYELYQDVDKPTVVTMLEEWESVEAIEAHLKAKHFAEIIPTLADCLEGPPELNSYKQV